MAEKDLLEIIARMTLKSFTEVSKNYNEQNANSEVVRSNEAQTVVRETGGGFPFGTPFPGVANFTRGVQSYTKSLDILVHKRYEKK